MNANIGGFFILNDKKIYAGSKISSLLDFIRKDNKLTGTKKGCGEGDCGACTVLIGSVDNAGELEYKSAASCVFPLGNAFGKHVATIEGLNRDEGLTPVQRIIGEENACQCGFCTPGIIMALTGYLIHYNRYETCGAREILGGHICRCTGYGAIIRAFNRIREEFSFLGSEKRPMEKLVELNVLPSYFLEIKEKLNSLETTKENRSGIKRVVGGGTDWLLGKREMGKAAPVVFSMNSPKYGGMTEDEENINIGAGVSIEEFFRSPLIGRTIPSVISMKERISSPQIRENATMAGNFVNGSPSADLSVLFLVLKTALLTDKTRFILLKDFFTSYKQNLLEENESILKIILPKKIMDYRVCFEKVGRREGLDIAAVNLALSLKRDKDKEGPIIEDMEIAVGGVAPVPLRLSETPGLMIGKLPEGIDWDEVIKALDSEIKPISDIRGEEKYRRILARQLFFTCWRKCFPETADGGFPHE